MSKLLLGGKQVAAAYSQGRRVGLLLNNSRPLLSRNLCGYGTATDINGMTCELAPDLGLHITSASLTAGKGVVWDMGILHPGWYHIRPIGDESHEGDTYNLVYIAAINMENMSRWVYWDAGKGDNMYFRISRDMHFGLAVVGKILSTGKPLDAVLHPMIAEHQSWPTQWVPPIHINGVGGGISQ
ncbi:hypothetical protein [Bifidobacterium samirii]|uniref:Uncharacterized protein n=1 Tax=Bifidobacterium samirii TaxID=2306974 RepID=A0A430FEQ0_9BIFI|nr:hypothetical protein [Bifidobacterium samirii]RSX51329.1 hypothetical protein D2E24_1892 [Bifidobacterium samirii]